MKRRNAFVANSSSSSFLLGHDPKQTKVKVMIEVDLDSLSRRSISTADGVIALCKEYDYSDEMVKTMLAEIEAGRVISYCTAYTDDGGIEGFLAEHGENGELAEIFEGSEVNLIEESYND